MNIDIEDIIEAGALEVNLAFTDYVFKMLEIEHKAIDMNPFINMSEKIKQRRDAYLNYLKIINE